MPFKKASIILAIIVILVSAAALFYIYARQGRLIDIIRQNLEESFSESIGTDVSIGSIGGNIFNKVIINNLRCSIKGYEISFKKARLEYSLLDVALSGNIKAPGSGSSALVLSGGAVKFPNGLRACSDIKGRIRLAPEKIILEDIRFKILGAVETCAEGEFTGRDDKPSADLLFAFKPFFDNAKSFFKELTLRIEGPLDNLSIYADLDIKGGPDLFADGYLIFSEKTANLGAKFVFNDPHTGDRYDIFTNTEIDLEAFRFDTVLIPPQGRISFSGDFSKWPVLTMAVENRHVRICGFDFLNTVYIVSKAVFKNGDFSHLLLDLNTESTVFNYCPMDELEASFWIDKDILRVIYMKIGDTILTSGALTFGDRPGIFLKTTFTDFDVSNALALTGKQDASAMQCRISGELLIEGPLDRPLTKAGLEAGEGYLGNVEYENMILNLKGIGPMLRVYESRLVRKDSFLTIEGTFDLRKLGSDRFMENIKISTDEKTIVWEGWDISKAETEDELTLSKGVDGGVKVGFKTYAGGDETAYRPVETQDELSLEYGMPAGNGTFQIKAKEKEDFVGVMKKYRF